jgi:hypothetical protein
MNQKACLKKESENFAEIVTMSEGLTGQSNSSKKFSKARKIYYELKRHRLSFASFSYILHQYHFSYALYRACVFFFSPHHNPFHAFVSSSVLQKIYK